MRNKVNINSRYLILLVFFIFSGSVSSTQPEPHGNMIKEVDSDPAAVHSEETTMPEKRGDMMTPEQRLAEIIKAQLPSNFEDKAYPKRTAKWPANISESGNPKKYGIFVCWENLDVQYKEQRELVKSAVSSSWQEHSAIRFEGWGACAKDSVGIRIKVVDDSVIGPQVKKLGKFLAFKENDDYEVVPNGMILNFEFQNWGKKYCSGKIDHCIKSIAVHEFGHAIGFAHEQNRSDTPEDCRNKRKPQGENGDDEYTTVWDELSVMNYCNHLYNNNGVLSELDKKALGDLYGS